MNRDRLKKYKVTPDYKYFPENQLELAGIIRQLVDKRGYKVDLNDIDVSKVDDMSYLFTGLHRLQHFNGDISKWDVSRVKNMEGMFRSNKKFNGDISDWDVVNVHNMRFMFESSKFDGDLSDWNPPTTSDQTNMFSDCPLENHPPKWYHK